MTDMLKDKLTISGKKYSVADIVKEKDEYIRMQAVDYNFALHELVRDKSSLVRTAIARKKVGHDKLAFDKEWRVRATVAQHCVDLEIIEILAKDKNEFVRYIIAQRGYCYEFLISDPDEEVAYMAKIAKQNSQAA